VTCYFRHLKPIFDKAGVEITKANKREIDRIIHAIVCVEYKNCSTTWREVKKKLAEDEQTFITRLQEATSELGTLAS
jgi:hypothetical protein